MKRLYILIIIILGFSIRAVPQVRLFGKISDLESGEPLAGVYIKNSSALVISDANGFYSIDLPKNKVCEITYALMGYNSFCKKINIAEDTELNIHLKPSDELLPELKVSSYKLMNAFPGSHDLSYQELTKLPALLGEPDILKALQYLPSVQSANEGQGANSVRGLSPDATYILVDGIPLYNGNHSMGLISSINPEAVKALKLYTSFIPSNYGGRMGAVVSAQTKDGNVNRLTGNVALSPISARANIEIPIIKGKSALSIATRRSLTDLFVPLFNRDQTEQSNFSFWDSNIKLTYKPSSNLSISLTGLVSGDKLWSKKEGNVSEPSTKQSFNWGNYGIGLSLHSFFTGKWSSALSATTSSFRKSEEQKSGSMPSQPLQHHNSITEYAVSWNNKLYLSNSFTGQVGTNLHHKVSSIDRKEKIQQTDISGFIGAKWQIYPWLTLNAVLRAEYPFPILSPRVALSILPATNVKLDLCHDRAVQRINTVGNNNTILQTNIWFFPTEAFPPTIADQSSITFKISPTSHLKVTLAGYYTNLSNVLDYKDGYGSIDRFDQLNTRIGVGNGVAYGIEGMAEFSYNGLNGTASYTFSRTAHKINQINDGNWYHPYYDRPHRFITTWSYRLNPHWHFAATWNYTSGNLQTIATETIPGLPLGVRNGYAEYVEVYPTKNNVRLPSYHRLDVAVNYSYHKWSFGLSIYNAYNQMNVYRATSEEVDGKWVLKGLTLLPIIPSINAKFSF